jgi:3-oxoacyl-[acyl-carrier protein] reductase
MSVRRFEDKVALVTGGSRGIGAAVARRLGAEGAKVAVNYAGSEDAALAVCADIQDGGCEAEAFQADVSDPQACQDLVDTVIDRFGALDVLVNNAGITRDGLLVRMSQEDWQQVIDTNLTGIFSMTKAAARPMMKARSGAIVNMTSVIGLVGNAGQANYAAAKAGVIGLTKSVARELAPRNIRVNAIAPGFIETDMTAELSEKIRETVRAEVALGTLGTPEDIAAATAYICSDEARYVTGQVLAVDGGMTFV